MENVENNEETQAQDTETQQEEEVSQTEAADQNATQGAPHHGQVTAWKVKTEEGEIELNSGTLLDALLGKVLQTPKADFDELIINFAKFLQTRDLFGEMKFNQLIGMSFAVGYFYRVFLEKNDVEIHITDISNAQSAEDSDGVEASANTEVETEENSSNMEEDNEVVDESAGNTSGEESNSATS